jgi:hypothetical protein
VADGGSQTDHPPAPSCDVCGRLIPAGEAVRTFTREKRRYLVFRDGIETQVVCGRCAAPFARGRWRGVRQDVAPTPSFLFVMRVPGHVYSWLRFTRRPQDWEGRVRQLLEDPKSDETRLAIVRGRASPRWWLETQVWADAIVEGVTREVAEFVAEAEAHIEVGRPAEEHLTPSVAGLIALSGTMAGVASNALDRIFRPARSYTTSTVTVEAAGQTVVRARMAIAPEAAPPGRASAVTDVVPSEIIEKAGPFSAFCLECRRYYRDETLTADRSGGGGCMVPVGDEQRQVGWQGRVGWSCPAGHVLFHAYRDAYLVAESSPITWDPPRMGFPTNLLGGRRG